MKFVTGIMAVLIMAVSCKKEEGVIPPPDADLKKRNMLILNEGLLNMNNASISLYNIEEEKIVTNDFFTLQNKRGLGDTGTDMVRYGSKIYIVVNISSQVEVIDASGKSIKQIPLFSEASRPRQPRYITFSANKAYVCCFDGTVARIDTASLEVEAITHVGRNPDGICVSGNKLYVSNSGGLDFPDYDKTVSVVDIATFKEIKKIEVRINPYTIAADHYGDVYVVSRGNYSNIKYCLQRIDTQTDQLAQTFDNLETLNFSICKDKAYCYNYDFIHKTSSFKILNVKTEQLETEQFITDGTTLTTPYGINVDPDNEDVYITDAHNFTVSGDVYCFDKQGKKKFSVEAGLNPVKIVFTK